MSSTTNPFNKLVLSNLLSGDKSGNYYSLPELEKAGLGRISRLPHSIRIVLESLVRNCDGIKVTEQDVRNLAAYDAAKPAPFEIPFVVARIVLQDFTGVPLLVDLAAMRSAVDRMGGDPRVIEPLVPVDLVVDHSVQVDFAGTPTALRGNLDLEFKRNRERYEFLKWGEQAFKTFKVVPPGIGIIHQVNLEHLAKVVVERDGVFLPDSLVGTDSHTTMINGLGVVGWGVGGIEAEAGMLGQPVTFLNPEVVGVYLGGALQPGVTATDLVLRVTELLRKAKVVGKFCEFYGPGARALGVADRATIANMAPEYGATMGFFGVDGQTVAYMRATGRDEAQCRLVEDYFRAQGMWGIPAERDALDYTQVVELDLSTIRPSVAGPRRPQDRIEVDSLKTRFRDLLKAPAPDGYGKSVDAPAVAVTVDSKGGVADEIRHGSVLIASITSCTNTSNPSVMLAAGLLAAKANARGLSVRPSVRTSLAPGSRVVTDYLTRTGLQPELDKLGFQTVGYGCATCIGNSGPLDKGVEDPLRAADVIGAAVLSGNRNFEARVHQSIKANFLMSPPLVVAYAIAGTVDIDLTRDPIGTGSDGRPVFLRDIWPTDAEVRDAMASALDPEVFLRLYTDFAGQNPLWNEVPSTAGLVYGWNKASTYIQEPPFFGGFTGDRRDVAVIEGARPLGIFGDSITTDHISPAGNIKKDSPAGTYLTTNGVTQADFNSYGARRGNDRVMTRGTFANVRIKNLMVPGTEGGVTRSFAGADAGKTLPIFDAAEAYKAAGIPLVVIGGEDYGMGSSRDWAAKGTNLLGVKAVVVKSFERIHRSNLVGMGVLPLTFKDKADYDKVSGLADATFDVLGISNDMKPMSEATLRVHPAAGAAFDIPVVVRIDTPVELEYYRAGGILPFVLAQILRAPAAQG